jgi:hypothetical protein
VEFRRARTEDVVAFYGKLPPARMHAVVAFREGVPLMIGGIFYANGAPILFSTLKPEVRKEKKLIAKGIRIVMDFVNEFKMPLYAFANPDEPTAPYLLCKLGFKPTGVMTSQGEYLFRGAP